MDAEEGNAQHPGPWLSPGVRYMVGAAFFFSVMSLLVKLAGQRLPTQEVVLARSSVGALLSYLALRR
ncbi:MAG TPA: hypothetical protein VK966_09115, partial [Longimicrobiales bacterium]|nr:hypothetical protein [Longimicrobiales bacterium]